MLFNPTIQQKENIQKWINALRSGKFTQGHNFLESIFPTTHCCLGVVCRIFPEEIQVCENLPDRIRFKTEDKNFGFSAAIPSQTFERLFGFNSTAFHSEGLGTIQDELIAWNDTKEHNSDKPIFEPATFDDIANMLEDYLIACEVLNDPNS